eukprot:CAMPEP_0196570988 /NCGR_PEP_ID=MMETSP1081-20130531/1167_1 /TAXON_ID=36882 /ORGANISM="Pyramimonas amylifera, Strain CCMP720" /LENGTH=159 /DNA_ID=CAMNT_0041887727 /DNA_START=47 /DNA_END=526 /DNA_ORIENTATION=-
MNRLRNLIDWNIILISSLLLLSTCSLVSAEDGVNFGKMRAKELKNILEERGVSSDGIMEKSDLVSLAKESYHLPVVEKRVEKEEKKEKKEAKLPPGGESYKRDDTDLDELLKKMSRETGQGFNVFKPGDNMEDFMKQMDPDYVKNKAAGKYDDADSKEL